VDTTLLLLTTLGFVCGVTTGLVPGIHVNTAAPLAASLAALIDAPALGAAVFVCALSITHTFIDFLPATLLGVPDAETALAVLPAHRMMREGRGMEAIRLSGIASLFAVVVIVSSVPLVMAALSRLYPFIRYATPLLLVWCSLLTVIVHHTWKTRVCAASVFALSGAYGCIVLGSPWFGSDPLFPIFSGFFGISTLLVSLGTTSRIPEQDRDATMLLPRHAIVSSCARGTIAGSLVATLPGVGASQAAVIAQLFGQGAGSARSFIATCCSINTANALFALLVLFQFDKARNGALVQVQELLGSLTHHEMCILIATMVCAAGAAFAALHALASPLLAYATRIDYAKLSITGIVIQVLAIATLAGYRGLLMCAVAASIGMLPPLMGVHRTTLMAFLLVPVLSFTI